MAAAIGFFDPPHGDNQLYIGADWALPVGRKGRPERSSGRSAD